ncbi:MAG: DUF5723 family protein [Bacteroidales bacterium]|nr:DUF5723 family protein [Bacteroidales bacterium]
MKKILAATAIMAASAAMASAQDFKTGFFLDNYIYGYEINPALQTDKSTNSYFGIGIGNLGASMKSNVGVDNLFFPINGELYMGLNDNVSATEFLGGLEDPTKANVDANVNIVTFGKRSSGGKGFLNVALNLKSQNGVAVPKSLFEFLKSGGENNTYTVEDVNINTKNYLELAINYSRKIGIVTIGGTVKGLAGLAYGDIQVDKMSLAITNDVVRITGQGAFNAAMPIIKFNTDADGYIDFSDVDTDSFGLPGYGAALDLGIKIQALPNLMVSAAVCDLGAISWKKDQGGVLNSTYEYKWDDDGDSAENIEEIFKFKKVETEGTEMEMLDTKINVGAKYSFIFAPKLSVGAICSYRIGSETSKGYDARVGLSYNPGKRFGIAGSYGISSFGNTFGLATNLRLIGINIFAGLDGITTKYTPQMLPVGKPDMIFKGGVALAFGSGKAKKEKKDD